MMMTEHKMRKITVEVSVELSLPEAEVLRMGATMNEEMSGLVAQDGKGICLSANVVMYDDRYPIAQFLYFNEKGQDEKRFSAMHAGELSSLGYEITKLPGGDAS